SVRPQNASNTHTIQPCRLHQEASCRWRWRQPHARLRITFWMIDSEFASNSVLVTKQNDSTNAATYSHSILALAAWRRITRKHHFGSDLATISKTFLTLFWSGSAP